jgi:hypothetical protein
MNNAVSRLGGRSIGIALIAIVAPSLAALAAVENAGASAPPSLAVSPAGNYHDGQSIQVSVGSNSYFTPHSRIVIVECADPGGLTSNLPRDDTTCDGNTVQGNTLLISADGSFSQSSYTVYLLPTPTLGEQSNAQPICNQTNYCVLYVGQDQNDFTAPKVFSAPFLVAPTSGTTGTTSPASGAPGSSATTGTTGTSGTNGAPKTSTSTGADAAVSLASSATLANTGPPSEIEWVVVAGLALLLSGLLGRRLVLRGGGR